MALCCSPSYLHWKQSCSLNDGGGKETVSVTLPLTHNTTAAHGSLTLLCLGLQSDLWVVGLQLLPPPPFLMSSKLLLLFFQLHNTAEPPVLCHVDNSLIALTTSCNSEQFRHGTPSAQVADFSFVQLLSRRVDWGTGRAEMLSI